MAVTIKQVTELETRIKGLEAKLDEKKKGAPNKEKLQEEIKALQAKQAKLENLLSASEENPMPESKPGAEPQDEDFGEW